MIVKGTGYDVNFFMNIRPAKGKESVQGNPAETKPTTFSETLRGKTDTIEISKHTEDAGTLLNGVKEKVMGEINRDTDPDFLEKLKSKIADGKYIVDPDELAQVLAR